MIFTQRNILIFIGSFGLIGIVAGLVITNQVKLNQPSAGLKIETNLPATVFIDNKQIGSAPLDQQLPPGEVLLRLVPDEASLSAQVFQTKIKLTDKVYTLVRRDFSDTETATAGETVTMLPVSDQLSPLSIVSDPDSASVHIDNQPQGFTPLNLDSLTPGNHQIDISAPGYISRSISLRSASGYKLQIVVKLASSGVPVSLPKPSAASPTPSPVSIPTSSPSASRSPAYVKILPTPTGFLRVRLQPSITSPEVARLSPGDRMPLLDTITGWHKITLTSASTTSGWISSEFSIKE